MPLDCDSVYRPYGLISEFVFRWWPYIDIGRIPLVQLLHLTPVAPQDIGLISIFYFFLQHYIGNSSTTKKKKKIFKKNHENWINRWEQNTVAMAYVIHPPLDRWDWNIHPLIVHHSRMWKWGFHMGSDYITIKYPSASVSVYGLINAYGLWTPVMRILWPSPVFLWVGQVSAGHVEKIRSFLGR